ncbi:MAG: CHASE2 domain-containing protein [Methylophilaceae bacterium]|nr:CHASE2 domain-containing protein [Methylophilaceae bacterium]
MPHYHFTDRSSTALILLLLALLVSYSGGLGRVDNVLYDLGQKLGTRPAPSDLVIVAIDEESLSRLGRWPWSRRLHAALIDQLKQDGARVIGLDLILAEPQANDPSADIMLAESIRTAGNVVLPVLIESNRTNGQMLETLPLPQLGQYAAALGRVHAELDEDGIARSLFLWEGVGTALWPHFAQAVLMAAKIPTPGLSAILPVVNTVQPYTLVRYDQRRINFLGAPGHVRSFSYAQVLNGEFPQGLFKDQIVLVGATAAGMGDLLTTPVSGLRQPMPGVEFHANALEAMRQDRLVKSLPDWLVMLVCAMLALAPLLWLPQLPPLQGLLVCLLWFVIVASVSITLPLWAGVWQPPSGALLAILLAYPVWSWRKLESASRFLDHELKRLHYELAGKVMHRHKKNNAIFSDPFQARIIQVQTASSRLRHLQTERKETLAFISHDIRVPLASALMQLEASGEATGKLYASLARALRLAEDFLSTSRAEMTDAMNFKETDMGSVLHQAADDAHSAARIKAVQLIRELPDEPVWVSGDFGLLHRAILNLIMNAVKFAPPDTKVTIRLEVINTYAEISVTDHGSGISQAQQAQLFKRFSRANAASDNLDGTGLGLYFVRSVTEKHGGSIGVASEPGVYTSFTMRLPLIEDAKATR